MNPDLAKALADLDANEASARALFAGLTPERLNWQPDGGKARGNAWSILQCLDHLARINRAYVAAMKTAVKPGAAESSDPIRSALIGRMFLRRLEPPVRQKVPAPRAVLPASVCDPAATIEALAQSHAEVRELAAAVARLDLNRLKFRNPFLPVIRMRLGTAFLILPAHERRHLWQAERVRAAAMGERD